MEDATLEGLIKDALQVGRFGQAARLAAEMNDIGLREHLFERILELHEAHLERQQRLDLLDNVAWTTIKSEVRLSGVSINLF
jgi:hypothetical protein